MQTRAAARKLRDEAVTASSASADSATVVKPVGTPSSANASEVVGSSERRGRDRATGGSKRKRPAKKQAQPLLGGWALPHGMGVAVAVAEPDPSSHQGAEPSLPNLGLAEPSAADPAGNGLSLTTAPPSSEHPAPKPRRQTRLSLRVTKAGVGAQKSDQKQEPVVKSEEASDDVDPVVKQENGRPHKRARITLLTTEKSHAATLDKGRLKLVQVKAEEKPIANQPGAKMLIIKGITLKDGVFIKTLDKIVVDASQILDPNFRLKIKRGTDNPYGLSPGSSPYPYRRVPTPEACEEVHRILTDLHGEVKQPEKMPAASLEIAGCGEVPCVLDALLRTLISGNTTMALADAAIKNLAQHYGLRQDGTGAGSINWEKARLSSHNELVQVIKVAGNGPKRSQHIKQILDMVYEENLERAKERGPAHVVANTDTPTRNLLSLDHMHGMSKDEAMAKFVSYPGIGIKTAACVTLFCLRMPCFAVDTHVHKFCRWLGWVPEKADPDNCFRHGDFMVPDHLKYGLHQLFIRHGQQCFKCRKATKPGTKDWNEAPDCPLEHLLDRSKDESGSKQKEKRRAKEEWSSGTDDSDSELDEDGGEELPRGN